MPGVYLLSNTDMAANEPEPKRNTFHGIHSYVMLSHRKPTKVTRYIEIKSVAAMGSFQSKNWPIIHEKNTLILSIQEEPRDHCC